MNTNLPLSGVRVLDLTQVYGGPTRTRILPDLGAAPLVILSAHHVLAWKHAPPRRDLGWGRHPCAASGAPSCGTVLARNSDAREGNYA